MKRIKVEAIYHISDSQDEGVFADRLVAHMRSFRDPDRSRNASLPHFESLGVFVERSTWDKVKTE